MIVDSVLSAALTALSAVIRTKTVILTTTLELTGPYQASPGESQR